MNLAKKLTSSGLVAAALLAIVPCAQALTIYVGETQSYQYINTQFSTTQTVASNWYATSYNDTGWFTGTAPFSDVATSATILNNPNSASPYAPGSDPGVPSAYTYWAPNYDPYLRTHFTLSGPTALTLWMAVDNGINSIYLNGVSTTATFNAEGHAYRWEHVLTIGAEYTHAGDNVLALQLEDHGGNTGFSLMITGDDGEDHPVFSTNAPAAAPDAGSTIGLLGLVFGTMLWMRRKAA